MKKINYQQYSEQKTEKENRFKTTLKKLEWDDSFTFSLAKNNLSWARHLKIIPNAHWKDINYEIFKNYGMKRVGENFFYYFYTDNKYFWELF